MPDMLIVLTTTPSKEEAESLAFKVVREKLAACVQVVPQITSFYWWENKIQKSEEWLLLIKTLPENFAALEMFIKANHSYSVPEISAIKAPLVSEEYLTWLYGIVK